MRFIFEYVTCCMMMSTPCNKENPSSHVSPQPKTEEEKRSLVTAAASPRSGRRRKRAPTRGSSADWQPSLFAIAEDNAAVAATVGTVEEKVHWPVKMQSSQRNVKRCAGFSGRVNDHSRSYEFSRDPIPMVVPAFSAAPFMF